MENGPWRELNHLAISHRSGSRSGDNQADMFDLAEWRICKWADVLGPFPPRLVRGPPDCEPADSNGFELAQLKLANFVRLFEPLYNYLIHLPLPLKPIGRGSLSAGFAQLYLSPRFRD
jgi:hypothetical protein